MEQIQPTNPQTIESLSDSSVKNRLGNRRNTMLYSLIVADSGTIARFGRKVGFGRSQMSQIVNGLKVPTPAEMIKISQTLKQDSRTVFPEAKQC